MKELERFKAEINLTEFAASRGYALDRRESSRASATMRHFSGDKVIISKSASGDWVYFSVRDDRDNGTIIDFLQKRGGGSLGQIRKTLRAFCGSARPVVPIAEYIPNLLPMSHDRAAAVLAYSQANFRGAVPYLVGRGLDAALQGNERFLERFKIDKRGNVLFPHYDKDGLSGFEIKNKGFTGFSAGGLKGLWFSLCKNTDKALVLTESAIDALSFHALNPDEFTRYMSTGGAMNPTQPALIRAAMEKMPRGSVVFLAFDHDEGGERLADEVKAMAPAGLDVRRPLPPVGKDWNEALKRKLGLD